MSYPPPPDPNNPYAQGPPPGAAPYGYPQQGPPPGPPPGMPGGAPGYGYPQAPPPYGGGPWMPERMPGMVVTARVLLFVAGSIWALGATAMLVMMAAFNDATEGIPLADESGDMALGFALIMFLIYGGIAALHIVPASMFGRGAGGTRVTAIIAGVVNAILPCLGLLGSAGESPAFSPLLILLWAGTAILTIVFCSVSQASHWFNRPRYR